MSKKDKLPSPCVGICKDKRGVCIACGRTEDEEKAWKRADSREEKLALLAACAVNTNQIGTRRFWEAEYRRKCAKKGVECPLDVLNALTAPSSLKALHLAE